MTDNNDIFNNPNDNLPATNEASLDIYIQKARDKFTREGNLDIDALLRGKAESDRFIEVLQDEKKEMRRDINERINLEKFVAKLEERVNVPQSTSNQPNQGDEKPNEGNVNSTPVSMDDVAKLVQDALTQESSKRVRAENLRESRVALEKLYGPNYSSHLQARADELGVTKEFMNKLAGESPKALIAVLGKPANEPSTYAPPKGTTNTHAVAGGPGERTFKWYEKMRKEDPKRYWSVQNTQQMHKDAARMGVDFYS